MVSLFLGERETADNHFHFGRRSDVLTHLTQAQASDPSASSFTLHLMASGFRSPILEAASRGPCTFLSAASTVDEWLLAMHMERYAAIFLGWTVEELQVLNQAKLEAMGVLNPGHRKRLLIGVKRLADGPVDEEVLAEAAQSGVSDEPDERVQEELAKLLNPETETAAVATETAAACCDCAGAAAAGCAVCAQAVIPDCCGAELHPSDTSIDNSSHPSTPHLVHTPGRRSSTCVQTPTSGWRYRQRCPSISRTQYRPRRRPRGGLAQRMAEREAESEAESELAGTNTSRGGSMERPEAPATFQGAGYGLILVVLCADLRHLQTLLEEQRDADNVSYETRFSPRSITDADLQTGFGRYLMMTLAITAMVADFPTRQSHWEMAPLYPLAGQKFVHWLNLISWPSL